MQGKQLARIGLGFAGLVSLVGIGTYIVRVRSGHDEPLTVENPRVSIGFDYWGHPLHVTPDPAHRKVKINRDITKFKSAWAYPRNASRQEVQADFTKPIEIYTSTNEPITITVQPKTGGMQYDQVVITGNETFGNCSALLNACSAGDGNLRLSSIRYQDRGGTTRHYCLNAWEDLTNGAGCQHANDKKTRVEINMGPE